MAGLLTLSESRRAVGWEMHLGARRPRGLYGVRSNGCGVADRVRRTPKIMLWPEGIVQCFRTSQTVVKVCCWHQDLSVSTLVRFCSFCSS